MKRFLCLLVRLACMYGCWKGIEFLYYKIAKLVPGASNFYSIPSAISALAAMIFSACFFGWLSKEICSIINGSPDMNGKPAPANSNK